MKHSINKKAEEYLKFLATNEEKSAEAGKVHEYIDSPDQLDLLIKHHDIKIVGLNFYPELDLMLIVLNNKKIIKRKISDFKKFQSASLSDLENYGISRYGVHWEKLDEDLSLRGFLQYELNHLDMPLSA